MDTADRKLALGIDLGATLAKVAVRRPGGELELVVHATAERVVLSRLVETLDPTSIGLTGGGAAPFAERLGRPSTHVQEFEAWRAGALRLAGDRIAKDERHLLVSLGTGTSVLLVDGDDVSRVGGTALGGGTIVGLGQALCGTSDFVELRELAARGDRACVDLRVGDIYREGEIELPGELNAASFGKLARSNDSSAADRAAGLMGLVGENVVLICAGIATACGVERIVYGGSTLDSNPALVQVLEGLTIGVGRKPLCLPDGEFSGALGALEMAGAQSV